MWTHFLTEQEMKEIRNAIKLIIAEQKLIHERLFAIIDQLKKEKEKQ